MSERSELTPCNYILFSFLTDTCHAFIDKLQEEFGSIQEQFIHELTSSRVSVDSVLQTLTTYLPFQLKNVYEREIQRKLSKLEKRKRIKELFYRLNPLYTFIDYELLQHMISKLGSIALKERMTSYVSSTSLFKSQTTVDDLITIGCDWPVARKGKYCKRLRIKLDCDPKTYTLEELDDFRRKHFIQLRLSHYISFTLLSSLEQASSFYVVWLIPTEIAAEVIAAASLVDSSFYVEEGVVMVSLDGNMLYHAVTKSLSSSSQLLPQQL